MLKRREVSYNKAHQRKYIGDELASGVNSGVLDVAVYLGRLADAMEGRSRVAIGENLEALKVRSSLF